MKTTAVILGKFRGPHLGHAFMIRTAIELFDNVVVVVSDDDESFISMPARVDVLRKAFPTVYVKVIDYLSNDPGELDEHGTAVDKEFIKKWAYALEITVLPLKLTHVVSSDRYGKELADCVGVEWFPVDPDRRTFNMTATMIRNYRSKYFHMLMPEARSALTKRIAIVGAESTGKTTMSRYLATAFDTISTHEWGRYCSEAKNHKLDITDFDSIIQVQQVVNDIAFEQANYKAFQDTDAFTTYNFIDLYTYATADTKAAMYSKAVAADSKIAGYIVLAPTIPFVQDGTRTSESIRDKMHQNILNNVIKSGKPYTVINSNNYNDRYNAAHRWVSKFNS